MTDHLPECPLATDCKHDYYNEPPVQCADCGEVCICDLLRACEQRVADDIWGAIRDGSQYKSGFEGGLDAAREAVAALEPLLDRSKHEGGYDCCGCATVGYLWADALDAIDALKESK